MLDDLIELYFYIKNSNVIDRMQNWYFETSGIKHQTKIKIVMNPHTGELKLVIKVYVVQEGYSKRYRIDPERIVCETNYKLQVCNHKGCINKSHHEQMLTFATKEELIVLTEIYEEINSLYKRGGVK